MSAGETARLLIVDDERALSVQRLQRENAELQARERRCSEELAAAYQTLESFAFSVSHDLRSPLRAIEGFAQILLDDFGPKLGDDGHDVVRIIHDACRKMDQLIVGLLAFSQSGRHPLKLVHIDMTEMVKEVVTEVLASYGGPEPRIEIEELPHCSGDVTVIRPVRRPAGVDIEITESMLMQDIELSIRKLAELRDAGIGVAIDDFGTGYSSLRLLSRLPVDTLKIDRSFVQNITDAAKGLTLISTIVSLARAFNMRTVAEGVETAEQLRTLHQIACDQAQGFLFARPGPASEVPSVIASLAQPVARTMAEQVASRRH